MTGVVALVTTIAGPTASATSPLAASKTAEAEWTRTFTWTIEKSVTPALHELMTGESGTSTYTVALTKSAGVDSDVTVEGEVCVQNNGAVATENLTINDRIVAERPSGKQMLASALIDTSANPVLDPGESDCYPYSFVIVPVADATSYYNDARVTITNDPRGPGTPMGPSVTAPFTIPATPTLINDSVNVDDSVQGSLGTFGSSASVSYQRTFTCDEDAGTHNNTATIRETGQNDSASVEVRCTPPEHGCTLTPGYWKTHSMYGPASYDSTWALIGENTTFFLSGKTWYQVLWTPPSGGNAYYILAHAYIAARLNVLAGTSTTPAVDAALAWATAFFSTHTPSSSLSGSLRATALGYATTLDNYNNGLIGPGHC